MSVRSSGPDLAVDALTARAVEAWLAHGLGTAPTDVTVLKEARRKSAVLRLHEAGSSGSAVIAKYCPSSVAAVERTIYEQVLPALPVPALRLFAATEERDGRTWLFLEDAGDLAWAGELAEHRRLASEWLAAAHVAAAEMVDRIELPLRDTDYYWHIVHSATATLDAAFDNEAIDSDGRALLGRLLAGCAVLDAGWGRVERLFQRFPRTLTLPGFSTKNVRVRSTPAGDTLLPLDFESAGWGAPAADLRNVDVSTYAHAVGATWHLDESDLDALAALGAGLGALKSIPGEAPALLSPWPQYALRKLSYYAASVAAALPAVGADG